MLPSNTQQFVNRKIEADLLEIDKHVGWNNTMVVDQIICKVTEDGWLFIVKAHRNGQRKVAYVSGETYSEAMELGAEFAKRGCLTWQKDRWPPKLMRKHKP